MREGAVGLLLLLAALLQVTAAPLFPLSGAVVDFALLSLTLIAVFLGPRWAMVCLPLLALLLGFWAVELVVFGILSAVRRIPAARRRVKPTNRPTVFWSS